MHCYRGNVRLMTYDAVPNAHGILFTSTKDTDAVMVVDPTTWDLQVDRESRMGFALTHSPMGHSISPAEPGIPRVRHELCIPIWAIMCRCSAATSSAKPARITLLKTAGS